MSKNGVSSSVVAFHDVSSHGEGVGTPPTQVTARLGANLHHDFLTEVSQTDFSQTGVEPPHRRRLSSKSEVELFSVFRVR